MENVFPESQKTLRNGTLAALVWTMLNILSLGWDIHGNRRQSLELARHEAAAYLRKDIAFRNWGASHGGVYVPPSETTPSNPYLKDIPDRDIVSTSGKRLTLMNPAYMMRDMQSRTVGASWGKGHVTSLKLINPINAPDDWEKSALQRLERGATEVAEFIGEGSGTQLRMMLPLHIEKDCLKCHNQQSYKEGDLRGGITVALDMEHFLASAYQEYTKTAVNHGLIWLLGLTSIGFLTRRAQKRESERLALQQALHDSAERFSSITTSALDAIIMMNDQGQIAYWNPAAETLFGYRAEETIGRDLHAMIMPQRFAGDFRRGFEHYIQCGEGPTISRTLELTAQRRDGKEFPVELSVSPTSLEGRRHAIGIVRDISERKRAETALRASEEQLNEAQRIAHLGRYTYDLRTDRWESSDILDSIFGIDSDYPRDRHHWLELVAPESRSEMHVYLSNIIEQHLPFDYEYRIVRRCDGQERWVHGKGKFQLDEQGNPLTLVGIIQDISEHKQAEQELLQHRSQLEELVKARTQELSMALESLRISEQRQRLLFESSRDALMLLVPPSWKFTGANRATLQMFGVASTSEFSMLGPWDVSPERQPDGRLSNEKAQEMIATAMREGAHFFEWEHRRLGGQPFAADVLLTRMEVGEEVLLQATVRDITERKQAVETLRQLNDTLEKRVAKAVAENMEHERLLIQQSRLAAMGEMVQNIAHQWRQPLSAVGLILQNIALDYEDNLLTPSSLQKYAENGKDLVQKMTNIIDDFRDFFTPDRKKTDFSLHQTIDSALNIVNASFLNHGIAINFDSGADVQVTGYPNEFSQVLVNLLGNAKEAILERKIRDGKIDIALGQDEECAWVTVMDNGGGIAEDTLTKIFDPYFTTKIKGAGIGLYMSKMIMAHMDGTIEAHNREGGAEFRVAMPKSKQSPD